MHGRNNPHSLIHIILIKTIILLNGAYFPLHLSYGQEKNIPVNTDWDHERHSWQASWIGHPTASPTGYGVFIFRNTFNLKEIPASQIIYVSADNRYRLFVNGKQVCSGPARGSLQYWRYETIDISPYLNKGLNTIAAEVFNLGIYRPVAQFSHQTAFILQAEGDPGRVLNTGPNSSWKVSENKAYKAIPVTREMVHKFYVAGPCDTIFAEKYPWNWEKDDFNDTDWEKPITVSPGAGRGYMHGVPWMLVPRNIPMMEEKPEQINHLIRRNGETISDSLYRINKPLIVPPGSNHIYLIDQHFLTIGYPELQTRNGAGSIIKVIYSEALYNEDGSKGNRDDTHNKEIIGYYDVFIPDGKENTFRPLWLRTFRFIQLEIKTTEEPLIISGYNNMFTAYPLKQNASFKCSNPKLSDIWRVGWHTARLCAGETYMDCPYWEQLQYLGDARIQALISLYVSGDDRLMRNALLLADQSRIPEGLTMGRAPSFIPQVTPPFSLYWIDMIHDYFQFRSDDAFIRGFIPGIKAVLEWFENRLDSTGMLGPLDWFNFTDWTTGFMVGCPAGVDTGHSALISLNFVFALEKAADIFEYFGDTICASKYNILADSVRKSVFTLCFDKEKQLLADTPDKDIFSQHTNIWAILTNTVPVELQPALMEKILTDKSLIQTTVYYKFYLFQALKKAGMGDLYISLLQPWNEMLGKGLTTFEEGSYDERSDCHAWSSSPCYDMLATICGITPAAPGFKEINIHPSLGNLNFIEATMPHPEGEIRISLQKKGNEKLEGFVEIPPGLMGEFRWHNQTVILTGGVRKISF